MSSENKKKLAASALLLAMASARADVSYELEAGVSSSDNIRRVDTGEIDETLAEIGLVLDWSEHSRRIDGTANVDLSYVDYTQDTYDSEVLGHATGDVTFGIVPERFTWQVQDTFGQSQTDPFSVVTPESRENINYFTTGPDFILHFGQAMSAQLFGRFSNTDYEDSPLDADRTSAGVAVGRQMSQRSRIALNLTGDETAFDEPTSTDYERRNAFLSYDLTEGGRTTMNLQAGYSWLEMDGADANGGALFNLDITRQLTAASSLTLTAGHEFSDSGELLNQSGGGSHTEITSSSDPFETTDASLEWRFDKHRTSLGLYGGYSQRRYETQTDIDSDRLDFSLDLGRQMRPTLRASLTATYATEDFVNVGLEADDFTLTLGVDWRFGRRLGMRVGYERYQRTASNNVGEYAENRAYLFFTFTGNRAPPSQ
jgi:hypothetical protein